MSSRCSIAYTEHFHFYSCCNTEWDIFFCANVCDYLREGYNHDIRIGHSELRRLYEELKKYFEVDDAPYEKYSDSIKGSE